jgi:hypothetical protein
MTELEGRIPRSAVEAPSLKQEEYNRRFTIQAFVLNSPLPSPSYRFTIPPLYPLNR